MTTTRASNDEFKIQKKQKNKNSSENHLNDKYGRRTATNTMRLLCRVLCCALQCCPCPYFPPSLWAGVNVASTHGLVKYITYKQNIEIRRTTADKSLDRTSIFMTNIKIEQRLFWWLKSVQKWPIEPFTSQETCKNVLFLAGRGGIRGNKKKQSWKKVKEKNALTITNRTTLDTVSRVYRGTMYHLIISHISEHSSEIREYFWKTFA